MTRDEAIRIKVIEILDHLPDMHNMLELTERLEEERTPQQHVFYQECERMNFLTARVRTSLSELRLGLDGALSISPSMQQIADELFMDKVPSAWQRVSSCLFAHFQVGSKTTINATFNLLTGHLK